VNIVVKGRNVEVPDHFRVHVAEKVARLERYDHKIIVVDVELYHERNRRQSKSCQRVEITGRGRGPVVRAEACASDFYAALDLAVNRLDSRLRRQHDRRCVHYGRRIPTSVAKATAALGATGQATNGTAVLESDREIDIPTQRWDDGVVQRRPGRIAREKEHKAQPMSVDQALYEMELVGHDFYLFADADSGRPSVVYRRKGYDYGVLRLT